MVLFNMVGQMGGEIVIRESQRNNVIKSLGFLGVAQALKMKTEEGNKLKISPVLHKQV